MNVFIPRIRLAAAFAAVILASTPILLARVQLKSLTFRSEGAVVGGAYEIQFFINSYSTLDEILMLKQDMMSGNIDGFYEALRAFNKARMQVTQGGRTSTLFNIALERQTQKGIRILLITESKIVKQGLTFGGLYYFLVIEFDLNNKYEGEGRVHNAGQIKFDEQGGVDLDSYATVPNKIFNIHRIK